MKRAVRRIFSGALGAAALSLVSPDTALACYLLAKPAESEWAAMIASQQADAWERSPLVYLAEVVEWDMTHSADEPLGHVRLKLAPLVVLKGEGAPQILTLAYPAMDGRCGRDFMDIASGAVAGDRFVVYATTASPASVEDIWTQIYGEIRDASAIGALADLGWLQPAPRPANQLGGN